MPLTEIAHAKNAAGAAHLAHQSNLDTAQFVRSAMKDSVQHDVDERDKSFDRDISRAVTNLRCSHGLLPNLAKIWLKGTDW
jgi:DNA topoisomerase VI subunit A